MTAPVTNYSDVSDLEQDLLALALADNPHSEVIQKAAGVGLGHLPPRLKTFAQRVGLSLESRYLASVREELESVRAWPAARADLAARRANKRSQEDYDIQSSQLLADIDAVGLRIERTLEVFPAPHTRTPSDRQPTILALRYWTQLLQRLQDHDEKRSTGLSALPLPQVMTGSEYRADRIAHFEAKIEQIRGEHNERLAQWEADYLLLLVLKEQIYGDV